MPRAICHLDADGARVRLLLPDGADESFVADQAAPDDDAPIADPRREVIEAADWTRLELGTRSRIDVVYLSADESVCTPLSAPSSDPAVIQAALRQRQSEWGDAPASLVQSLAKIEQSKQSPSLKSLLKRKSSAPKPTSAQVLLMAQDGGARLWLDEMDKRGVRVGAVASFWHAMVQVWSPGPRDEVCAVVMIDPSGSLLWTWARGGELITAGRISAAIGESSAAPTGDTLPTEWSRLLLDWITWTSQCGAAPERVVLVGAPAPRLAGMFSKAWENVQVDVVEADDPEGATLEELASRGRVENPDVDDPRACLVELSNRPGRALRRLYLVSSAAIVAFAVGVAGLGLQFRANASDYKRQMTAARVEQSQTLSRIDPTGLLARDPFPARALAARVNALLENTDSGDEPGPPKPILDELILIATEFQELEDVEGASVDLFMISENQASATVRGPRIETIESLRARLQTGDSEIIWRGTISGIPPNVSLRLTGGWANP